MFKSQVFFNQLSCPGHKDIGMLGHLKGTLGGKTDEGQTDYICVPLP